MGDAADLPPTVIAEFDDPRLAAIYDAVNTHDPDEQPAFVRRVLGDATEATIVDLGCGTGLIARELARQGHRVIGVDPSAAMIAVARRGRDADRVTWIVGDVSAIGTPRADLAIMTSHVAQFFVSDDSWAHALSELHDSLRPGGRIAFETRDPRAHEWDRWTPEHRVEVDDAAAGPIETWSDAKPMVAGVVEYANHFRFLRTGEELVSTARLRFRTLDDLERSLTAAGLTIDRVDGGWDGRPVSDHTPELIVVASR